MSFITAVSVAQAQKRHPFIEDCAITKNFGLVSETIRLRGNVRIITDPEEHADFRVKLISAPGLASVYIKIVSHPAGCGEWKWVTSGEDFSIRFVDEMELFTIRIVTDMPGCPY
ncbi:MAG: hypothetical protein LBN98_01745 [Prevotellaceae bacterium]|nr:hypothetical protein [Prevotellaceae bacterium]